MKDFFNEFKAVSKADWEAKIISDLKGKDPALLMMDDPIEEIQLKAYQHKDDFTGTNNAPGDFPYQRGMYAPSNDWNNGRLIEINDEKQAHKAALDALNTGSNLLVFKSLKENTQWSIVLADVQLEYIQTQFVVRSEEEFNAIRSAVNNTNHYVQYNIDFADGWSNVTFEEIAAKFKAKQQVFCSVSGFKVHQAGATTWQEIAFCLSVGHDYLIRLMNLGFTVDEAAACIGFKVGIGSNYFNEVAKFRAFRKLWAKVVDAYSPEHNCSYNCSITAVTGFVNKSLKDPYTNLLRQTTEAMSAVNAGVDSLVILPYDKYAAKGASDLALRMASNISSILQEEAYLNKVIDPLGGSYAVEVLTDTIGKKAWAKFQQLSRNELTDAITLLSKEIATKREMRIDRFVNKETTGIGINSFDNPDAGESDWNAIEDYLGMKPLILEREYKLAEA